MANLTVYARKDSPFYWAGFNCPKKLKYVYVKTPFRIDAPRAKFNALQWAGKRAVEGNLRKAHVPGEAWSSWVGRWLEDTYRASPLTLSRYTGAWKRWAEFLIERKIVVPAVFDHAAILAYVAWRETPRPGIRAVMRNTALVELKVMSAIMQEAVRRGFCQGNPCLRPGIKAEPKRHYRMIQPDEAAKIREALKTEPEWMRDCFEIGMHQGCRLSETAVAMDDVDLDRGTIMFHAKKGKIFTTRLHPNLRPMMEAKKAAGAKTACVLPKHPSKMWYNFFRREDVNLSHLTFHSTRVSVVTRLAVNNVPENKAMAFVGHASTSIHRIYARLKAEDLGDCVAALR